MARKKPKAREGARPPAESIGEAREGYYVKRVVPRPGVKGARRSGWVVHRGRWPGGEEAAHSKSSPALRGEHPVERLLGSTGIFVPVEELERMVAEALAKQRVDLFEPQALELSAAEAEVLERGGFDLDPDLAGEDPLARGIAEYAALLETARTVNETAAQAGVDPSRIRQRLAAHTLIGMRASGGWRIPLFQFAGEHGGLLPGLEVVAAAIDPEAHPLSIQRWFLTPHPDLGFEGAPEGTLSPREWLSHRLPPGPVAELAAEL